MISGATPITVGFPAVLEFNHSNHNEQTIWTRLGAQQWLLTVCVCFGGKVLLVGGLDDVIACIF